MWSTDEFEQSFPGAYEQAAHSLSVSLDSLLECIHKCVAASQRQAGGVNFCLGNCTLVPPTHEIRLKTVTPDRSMFGRGEAKERVHPCER